MSVDVTRYHCPVARCDRFKRAFDVMCRDCWHLVPAEIRNRVWNLWRRRLRGDQTTADALALREEHQAACREAIAAAEGAAS